MDEERDLHVIFVNAPRVTTCSLEGLMRKKRQIMTMIAVPSGPVKHKRGVNASTMGSTTLRLNLPILRPRGLGSRTFIRRLESCRTSLFIMMTFEVLPGII